MIFLAKNNWRITVDFVFGIYYLWWLLYYYKLTIPQVTDLIFVWMRSRFSFREHPSSESIRQGEGQLYPQMNKV
jgi:hypothetical protein